MTTTCNHGEKNKANCCQGPQHIACFRLERPWKKTRTYYYPTNNQVSVNCLSTKRTRAYF